MYRYQNTGLVLAVVVAAGCTAQKFSETSSPTSGKVTALPARAADAPDPTPAPVAPVPEGTKGADCQTHEECPSGVCDHYKKSNGFCAPRPCRTGDRADNNRFYCSPVGRWEPAKSAGEACGADYECRAPNCFMNPMCDLTPKVRVTCREGRCFHDAVPDACAAAGKVRALHPKEFWVDPDGNCQQSLAQRILETVCIPCGNGRCDDLESTCNCPEDCSE